MTDGSMWIITGVSDNYLTGSGEKNLIIYAGTDALPQPEAGAKSAYFMLIEGNSTTYFVKPLPPQTQIINDRIDFSSQYIDELLVLTNGSMWIITGVSDNYSTGSGEKNLKIYAGTDALPQPEAGKKSDYFMLIEGNSTTYFVNPLSPIFSLSVSKTGNGTVTSSPSGINCGTTCSAGFSSDASVTLTATPATADATVIWNGCAPVATNPRQCTVSMTSNQTVIANFASTPSRQVTVRNIDGAVGSQRFFKITVPAGATNLIIGTDGGSGNPNLYVKAGAKPQTAAADCVSTNAGTTEQCLFQAPQTGLPYYILLNGESSYSGVTLRVSWNP